MNTKSQKPTLAKKTTPGWYGEVFAILPFEAVLDKRLGPCHLKVLLILAKFANKHTGICYPGLESIAEMCGYYTKGQPDKSRVSRIISNASGKGTGPGLEQLGYLQKLGWFANRATQSYRVMSPNLTDENLNLPTNRKLTDEAWAEKRAARRAERDAKDRAEGEAFLAEIEADNAAQDEEQEGAESVVQESTPDTDLPDNNDLFDFEEDAPTAAAPAAPAGEKTVTHKGVQYGYSEVYTAWRDGDWGDIPYAVVQAFGFDFVFAD